MTTEVYNILLGIGVMLILLVASCELRAQEPNSEYLKQILRLQYTEFCANVGKPPKDVADGINGGIATDPKTWTPHALWFNKIVDAYRKAGCGDA